MLIHAEGMKDAKISRSWHLNRSRIRPTTPSRSMHRRRRGRRRRPSTKLQHVSHTAGLQGLRVRMALRSVQVSCKTIHISNRFTSFTYRDGLKVGPVMLNNSHAQIDGYFSQPRAHLLDHLCKRYHEWHWEQEFIFSFKQCGRRAACWSSSSCARGAAGSRARWRPARRPPRPRGPVSSATTPLASSEWRGL